MADTKRPTGRPRIYDAPATSSIRVRCTPAQHLELRRVADENGQRLSTIVREAVDEFVGDYRDGRVFRGTKR
jgi:hypothetical protein